MTTHNTNIRANSLTTLYPLPTSSEQRAQQLSTMSQVQLSDRRREKSRYCIDHLPGLCLLNMLR